ncbi:P-type conjugative transfer protein TrbG [Brevundimonas sp.]
MDTRRLLSAGAALTLLSGCALVRPDPPLIPEGVFAETVERETVPAPAQAIDSGSVDDLVAAETVAVPEARPEPAVSAAPLPAAVTPGLTGRRAIAAANEAARAASVSDGFVGGVQVFAWSPGRVFEVWTAPLRVTTLSFGPGETLVSKAAGDTVRWQIGEAVSGEGASRRAHVMLKPLERGLETNLVLTTNRRVYFIELKSGAAEAFNAAVAWDTGEDEAAGTATVQVEQTSVPAAEPFAMGQGPFDARYRIDPRGRRPRWTPTSVFNDGLRTYITFDPDMQVDEAPALFILSPDGEPQLVNYRQIGGLFIVDRIFDRAELRLGDRRPQVVRLERLARGGHHDGQS